jgi:Na+/H+ antiporter NhaD/arsenite permease-like protein
LDIQTSLITIFLIGYLAIIMEQYIFINKAAIALLMALGCWIALFIQPEKSLEAHLSDLSAQMFNVSQVLFFLLGALAIVEVISTHGGFHLITRSLAVDSKQKLLWITGFVTFFMSAVIDNLTSAIVMISIVHKLLPEKSDRWVIGSCIVVAANAGGAWTPIGDVATTILWIYNRISTLVIMRDLFLPSLVSLVVFLWLNSYNFKGKLYQHRVENSHFDSARQSQIQASCSERGSSSRRGKGDKEDQFGKAVASQDTNFQIDADTKLQKMFQEPVEKRGVYLLLLGIFCLIFVPIFKMITGLPPYLGMMLGLAIMWIATDFMHMRNEKENHLKLPAILAKVDLSVILFYLGILLSIYALETGGVLRSFANYLMVHIHPITLVIGIGLISSLIDNVTLVAATLGMFDLTHFPRDAEFWQLMAFTAGTGGSIFIIGSAAGIGLMALEKVDFVWYARKATWKVLCSFFAGVLVFLAFNIHF